MSLGRQTDAMRNQRSRPLLPQRPEGASSAIRWPGLEMVLAGTWLSIGLYSLLHLGTNGDAAAAFLAVAAFGIVVIPGFRYRRTGDNRYLIAAGLLALQYAGFALPYLDESRSLAGHFMGITYNPEHNLPILTFSAAFMAFYLCGFMYASSGSRSLLTGADGDRLAASVAQVPVWMIFLTIAGSILILNSRLDAGLTPALSFLGRLLSFTFPFGVVVFLLQRRSKVAWFVLFTVLYPLYFLVCIADGFLSPWILTNLIVTLGYALVRGRLPLPLLVVAALLTIPLAGAKSQYREELWYARNATQPSRLQAGLHFITVGLDPAASSAPPAPKTSNLSRAMMGPIVFSRVMEFQTSGYVPVQLGKTFVDLPLFVFPRFILPWKPEKNYGRWFGHTFGVLQRVDQSTSVNLPPIVESYVNFGSIGFLLAFPLGCIAGFISRLLGNARTPVSALLVAVVFSGFANAEASISIVYGQALQMFVLILVLLALVRRGGRGQDFLVRSRRTFVRPAGTGS